jgi:hypothetical protein
MRKLRADLAAARRDLIASKVLDNDPFLSRLWHHHLFWICSFVRIETTVRARGLCWAAYRRYCQLADRLFGGNREERYRERRRQYAARCEAKIRQVEAERQARHRIHQQFIAAVDQRQKELEEEIRALMHGNFVTRDPKADN